jgi:Domain of unknown function (DUF4157)
VAEALAIAPVQAQADPASFATARLPLLQRRCACGGDPGADGLCPACRAKRLRPQRATADSGAPPVAAVPGATIGRPLDSGTRTAMEAGFGHDFGRVRVHTGVEDARAAAELGAHAYTVGSDVFFAAGRYRPGSPAGARLLAHELAHTIQQQGASGVESERPIDLPGSPLEREADRAADLVLAGRPATVTGRVARVGAQLQAEESRNRPIEGGHIEVVRTLEERPCERVPDTQTIPRGDILYFDQQAEAFGIRYWFCRSGTQVTFESSLHYGQLLDQARQLVQSLPQTVLGGGDPLGAIQSAVQGGQIQGQASITAVVSGTLLVQVTGTTAQGPQEQSYEVEGLLRLAPGGSWALELDARYSTIANSLSGTTARLTFTPRVDLGPVQAGVTVERVQEQPVGGSAATPRTTVSGTVTVPFGQSGTGLSITGSSDSGGSVFITFGTVQRRQPIERPPEVSCYACDCKPPLPHYRCTRVIDPHTEPRITQQAGHETVRLHYQYDTTTPEDATEYRNQVQSIVGLLGQSYTVQGITGYASPEAGNRQHNLTLSQRRADAARGAIETALGQGEERSDATLPTAVGAGELFGQRAAGGETPDAQLIAELGNLITPLGPDERLDLLGIDRATLTAEARAEALARIDAFLSGREGARTLGTRLRWEKIFPYWRRADVELDRPRVTMQVPVAGRASFEICDADTLSWARGAFPALPNEQRVPARGGRCP